MPLFSYGVPHAYSYFHVSGVHYFTVSSCEGAQSVRGVQPYDIPQGKRTDQDQGF
ncbi:MAG: hypothetical protein ACLR0U_00830 [Enterocloster clostridioformis]